MNNYINTPAFLFALSSIFISSSAQSDTRIDIAQELIETVDLIQAIKNTQEEIWVKQKELILSRETYEKEFLEFSLNEAKRLIDSNLDWNDIRVETVNLFASTFTEEEMRSFIHYFNSELGNSYFTKLDIVDNEIAKIIKSKVESLEPLLEQSNRTIAENYQIKLKEEEPKSFNDIKRENFFFINIFNCYWPIPTNLVVNKPDNGKLRFYNPSVGLFEKMQTIYIEETEEQLQNLESDFTITKIDLVNSIEGLEIFNYTTKMKNRDTTINGKIVKEDSFRITLFGFTEVIFDYMLESCVDTMRKETLTNK